jgi:hypothetical protein
MVAVVAHWPADGVKVYVVVPGFDVLMVAGFHVPVMAGEFAELAGNADGVENWHNGPIWVKTGAISGLTTMFIVFEVAHWLGDGVKV